MKIQGNEIKPGMIIEHNNDHWTVLKAQHVKPGKGGAFNQVELKSLTKGTKLNQRFRSSENVERAQLEEKEFNFLYSDENECFFMEPKNFEQISFVTELEEIISDRFSNRDENSYISTLFNKGINKIAQKFGEEAVELVIESKDDKDELFLNESADVLFHFLILIKSKGFSFTDVIDKLEDRKK